MQLNNNVFAALMAFALTIAAGCGGGENVRNSGMKAGGGVDSSSVIIAVLPFANQSGVKTVGWLGTGVADSISAKLAAVKNVVVVERVQIASVVKESELGMTGLIDEASAPKVGKLLGAKTLVLGSFAAVGAGAALQLRFNCKVVDAETGRLLGGGGIRNTGTLAGIFDLEEQVAEAIVARIGLVLTADERRYFALNTTSSVAAYELYSQALEEPNAQSKKRLLERAVALDRNFARAHLALGYLLYMMTSMGGESPELVAHCTAAVKTDPRLIEAHYILASYYDRLSEDEDGKIVPANAKKAADLYSLYVDRAGKSPLESVEKRVKRAKKRIGELSGK